MSADELAAAVAELGALPMPVPVVPEPLSAERLAEIVARVEAATAGPWWTDTLTEHDGSESVGIDAEGDIWIIPCQDIDQADAEFMAHARVDVPALVAEVRRQAARIAELEAALADCTEPDVDGAGRTYESYYPERSVKASVFVPPASPREPEGEHYRSVHHDWRLGRDLPELGGLQ